MLHLAPHQLDKALQATAWMAGIGVIVTFFASKMGFFKWDEKQVHVRISTASLIEILGIFIILSLLGPLLFIHIVTPIGKALGISGSNWVVYVMTSLQIASEIAIILLISLYAFAHKRIDLKGIFKTSKTNIFIDIGFGALCWLISFPVVAAVDGALESFNLYFFGSEGPNQLAIEFILRLMKTPGYLWLGLLVTIFLAPLIEEFIFRGCLQTYLRNRVKRIQAIILSSLAFAFIHLSPAQGIGNIPLFGSIFAFGLYLGFVYEKRGSLFASFALHATFNAISIARMLSL